VLPDADPVLVGPPPDDSVAGVVVSVVPSSFASLFVHPAIGNSASEAKNINPSSKSIAAV
jgi:hypothetical protein